MPSASLYQAGTIVDNLTTQPASFTFAVPAGTPIGSIAFVSATTSAASNTITTPTNWSIVSPAVTTASNMTSRVYARQIVAGEPGSNVVFTASGGTRTVAVYAIVQNTGLLANVIAATPSAVANTTTTIASPTLVTPASDYMLLTFFSGRLNTTAQLAITPTGAQTEQAESNTSITSAPNFALSVTTANTNTGAAGTYGGFSATASAALTHAHAHVIAVPSAAATYNKGQFFPFLDVA